jgi:hypothetical protein|nr:MAG TPA: hypothetical protein [Bacteriophage sp.]
MYRTTITINPYAIRNNWVFPRCEQQKTAPKGGYRNEPMEVGMNSLRRSTVITSYPKQSTR